MLITSVNNNHIKELCRLKEKKYRDITGLFLVEGEHLVSEAIKNNLIKEVIVLDKKTFDYDGKIIYVSDSIMKKLSSMDSYPNVIGVCYKRKEEKSRLGGISETKKIIEFNYMKLNFNDDLIDAFNKMQKIYVLDEESKLSINDVKKTIKILLEVFKDL